MKKIIVSMVAMMVAATSFAQETVVASLSHEGETTIFYGLTALVKAAEKAQSGDIISLSRGIFNATTIKAAITLRGAGIDSDVDIAETTDNGRQLWQCLTHLGQQAAAHAKALHMCLE